MQFRPLNGWLGGEERALEMKKMKWKGGRKVVRKEKGFKKERENSLDAKD